MPLPVRARAALQRRAAPRLRRVLDAWHARCRGGAAAAPSLAAAEILQWLLLLPGAPRCRCCCCCLSSREVRGGVIRALRAARLLCARGLVAELLACHVLFVSHCLTLRAAGALALTGPLLEGATGRCLDASCSGAGCGTVAAGAAVTVWTCRPGALNQAWTLTPGGQLVESLGGNCLEFVPCASAGPGGCAGALLQVWPCNNWAGQTWSATPAGELRNGMTGFCVDVLCPAGNCSGVADNTPTLQYNCTGGRNQRWAPPSPPPSPPPPRPPPSPGPPPPSPPPRVATLPPLPTVAVNNASSIPPPPRPPPRPPASAEAAPAPAPDSLSAKSVVPWAIGGGMIVALAGFTCGACTPYAATWLRNRRGAGSIAPVADGDAGAADAEQAGDSSSPQQHPLEPPPSPLLYGCVPAWLLGDRPPPPPELPPRPRHVLARLSDRLARRVRLMRVIARTGSGAGGSFVDGAEGGEGRRRSSAAQRPPPLPERPWRASARRAEEASEQPPDADEYQLPP
jgi:hypothetical protein